MAHIPHIGVSVGSAGTSNYKQLIHFAGKHVAEVVIALDEMQVPSNLIYSFMATSAGSIEMNTSGTTAIPYNYYYTVTSGLTAHIHGIVVHILDGGITPSKFGGLAALTNGLTLSAYSEAGVLLKDFTEGYNIKRNDDFTAYGNVEYNIVAGDDGVIAHMSFRDHSATMLMTSGQYLNITVQDNLSALTQHRTMVHGSVHATTP